MCSSSSSTDWTCSLGWWCSWYSWWSWWAWFSCFSWWCICSLVWWIWMGRCSSCMIFFSSFRTIGLWWWCTCFITVCTCFSIFLCTGTCITIFFFFWWLHGEYNKLIEVKIFRGLYKCTQLVSPEHRQRAAPEQPRSIASATANKLKIWTICICIANNPDILLVIHYHTAIIHASLVLRLGVEKS